MLEPVRCLRLLLTIGGLAVALRGQWQRVDATAPVVTAVLREPRGAELQVVPGGVVRKVGRDVVSLENTRGGLGKVHGVALSPFGTSYFAADNGLFVTHPSVTTLDRLTWGAIPDGPIVGVVADRPTRVWLATPERLLVLDAITWFAAEHGVAQGLPPPPYRGLGVHTDGRLLLHTGDGAFAYRRDERAPTGIRAELVSADVDGRVRLDLAAHAEGTLTWRYREASHHMLRPIDGGEVRFRRPGRFDILVYAFDGDLDRSEPARLRVHVPAPPGLDVQLGALLAGAFALATIAACWWRAQRRALPWWRGLLDAALVLAILGQLVMAMTPIGRTYPFIGFTMYGETYGHDDVLFTPAVVGRLEDRDIPVRAGALDFATDGIWRHLTTLAFGSDEATRDVFRHAPREVREVDLCIRRSRLTSAGPRDVAPFVMGRLARPAARKGR